MRQAILTVTTVVLGAAIWPPIWDKFLSEAPDYVWRVVVLSFFVSLVLLGLLNEWVAPYVLNPSQHRGTSSALLGLGAAIVVGATWWLFVAYTPPPLWSVVTVYPSEFPLNGSGNAIYTKLTVTNTGTRPLYSVSLDLTSNNRASGGGISYKTDVDPNAIKLRVGQTEVIADAIGFSGWDENGIGFVTITFYQLLPNAPRHVTVSGSLEGDATAKIIGAQENPPKIVHGAASKP